MLALPAVNKVVFGDDGVNMPGLSTAEINKRLIELINADPEYCHNFQYSILEVFPIKKDRQEVLECERLYKNKLLSVQYGLNDNC